MNLRELVSMSDFKKFYFIVGADNIKRHNIETIEVKLNLEKGNYGINYFNFFEDLIKTTKYGYKYYDLGLCLTTETNARITAKFIDLSKAFKIVRLEHENDALYIHLEIKNIGGK